MNSVSTKTVIKIREGDPRFSTKKASVEPDRSGLGVVRGSPWNGVSVRMEEDGGVLL